MRGELYDCHAPIFIERKAKAAEWCERYNSIPYARRSERKQMLGELLGSVGTNVSIGTDFICDFGDNIHIGNNVSINHRCLFVDSNKIVIGNNVLIGKGEKVLGPFTVGDGARIAANAVVLQEVPANATAVGAPAHVVRIAGEKVNYAAEVDQIHVDDPVTAELNALRERLEKLEKTSEK